MTDIDKYVIIYIILYFYSRYMLKIVVAKYYKFFDETISSSTFIVLMITCLIFAAWSMSPTVNANNYKWNIREAIHSSWVNTVIIDWVEYQLSFTKVSWK